jgi:hypothetical protein
MAPDHHATRHPTRAVLDVVAHDPAFAGVAARQHTLLAEAAAHRRATADRAVRRARQLRLRRLWARPLASGEATA